MGKVVSLEEYRAKKLEAEVQKLSRKLSHMIDDLCIDMTPQPYFVPLDEVYDVTGYDYLSEYQVGNPITDMSEVTDALTGAMLALDGLGHKKWADQIGDMLGEIFNVKK